MAQSAFQQAITNIKNFGGFSPRNIKRQISAIPRWAELSVINSLGRVLEKARPGLTPDQPTPKQDKRISVKALQPSPSVAPKSQPTTIPTATPIPYKQRIKIPSSTGKGKTTVPLKISQAIMDAFDPSGKATESAQILHHPYEEQVKGFGHGENARFQTELDVPNRINKDGNYDPNAPIVTFEPPFPSLGTLESVDRGLYRINNRKFYDMLATPAVREQMHEVGIIDSKHVNYEGLNKDNLQEYWDRMKDPVLNARMAAIIFEDQGYGAWFAAPKRLVQQ